jgi:2-dehydro-3-deoxygluconokinase
VNSAAPPPLVAFGELLLRLDAPLGDRLRQADRFMACYTGAEANVAASLAGFGIAAELVSAVPDDAIGAACLAYLRRFGVGTGNVLTRPGRLGLFFHEAGGAGRPASVIYDRAGSVFATCDPAGYDWATLLAGRSWLHLSGTSPALGPKVRTALREAMTAARELGVGVSLDLNYRRSLWTLDEAGREIADLLPQVDVLLGSGPDAAAMFDTSPPHESAAGPLDWHVELAVRLREHFDLRVVAGTAREGGCLHGVRVDADGAQVSAGYPVLDPVGRIGTGDAFAAGLLYCELLGRSPATGIEFAAAAAHLKQSIRGDVNLVTAAEVEAVIAGETGDRVQR